MSIEVFTAVLNLKDTAAQANVVVEDVLERFELRAMDVTQFPDHGTIAFIGSSEIGTSKVEEPSSEYYSLYFRLGTYEEPDFLEAMKGRVLDMCVTAEHTDKGIRIQSSLPPEGVDFSGYVPHRFACVVDASDQYLSTNEFAWTRVREPSQSSSN